MSAALTSPNLPTLSALDERTQSFPVLTEAQIARIRSAAKLRKVAPGEILFEPGDAEIPFFVLISGKMEIVQPDYSGERAVATHDPGEFTGEITMISGRRSLVRGRVTDPDGLPLPGVVVTIAASTAPSSPTPPNTAVTDSQGAFAFEATAGD